VPEKKFNIKTQSIFIVNVVGIATGRDAWSLSFSKNSLSENMQNMIAFFNEQSNAFAIAKQKNTKLEVEEFIDQNPLRISWTRALRKDISKNIQHSFKEQELVQCLYRPYTKEWLYYDRPFIESPSIWSQIFPTPKHKNVVISCINVGSSKEFSTIISDTYSEYQLVFANQSFPSTFTKKTAPRKRVYLIRTKLRSMFAEMQSVILF